MRNPKPLNSAEKMKNNPRAKLETTFQKQNVSVVKWNDERAAFNLLLRSRRDLLRPRTGSRHRGSRD